MRIVSKYRESPAQLVDVSDFIYDIHRQLLPLHEEWIGGIKLAPTNIYGIRINRNNSALALHYDKVEFFLYSLFPSCACALYYLYKFYCIYILMRRFCVHSRFFSFLEIHIGIGYVTWIDYHFKFYPFR